MEKPVYNGMNLSDMRKRSELCALIVAVRRGNFFTTKKTPLKHGTGGRTMRITADNIEYNALRIIDENTLPWEMSEQNDDSDHQRIITLGYIRGVLDMAQTMKEVLKT